MSDFLVTFDVFSALIDSRTGGSAYFADRAVSYGGWAVTGQRVYDDWDAQNKRLHAQIRRWRPFAEIAEIALASVYLDLGIASDVTADCRGLLASMTQWPLWPDVTKEALIKIGHPLGLLSNIDDALLTGTAPLGLGCFDPDLVLTSQRLQSYKPAAEFYLRAAAEVGPLLHVASSARDIRGSLESGLTCVRLARPGHRVDPEGSSPLMEVAGVSGLPAALASFAKLGVGPPKV